MVSEQRLRYALHGEGQPVLTVANVMERPEWWPMPFVPTLVSAGFQVITLEHLGPNPSSLRELASDAGALVEHLDIGKVRLWGYSQGALIAQELALARPDLVHAAVLTATSGRPSAFGEVWAGAYRNIEGRETDFPQVYAFLSMIGMCPSTLAKDKVVESLVGMLRAGPGGIFDAQALERSKYAIRTHENRLDDLVRIAVPCLVLSMANDLIMLPALGKEVAERIPNCQYAEIQGAGHDGRLTPRKSWTTSSGSSLRPDIITRLGIGC